MQSRHLVLFSLCALLLPLAAPGAIISIDDFSTTSTTPQAGLIEVSDLGVAIAGSPFSSRELTAESTSGNGTTTTVAGGVFGLSTNTGTTGIGQAIYTGVDVDLSDGMTILIDLTFGNFQTATASIMLTDSGGSETQPFTPNPVGPSGPPPLSLDLSLFTTIDLTDIQELAFIVQTSTPTDDLEFDNLRYDTGDEPNGEIPEPGTVLLFGGALIGLAALRRRRS